MTKLRKKGLHVADSESGKEKSTTGFLFPVFEPGDRVIFYEGSKKHIGEIVKAEQTVSRTPRYLVKDVHDPQYICYRYKKDFFSKM